jgi:hypothetical protein
MEQHMHLSLVTQQLRMLQPHSKQEVTQHISSSVPSGRISVVLSRGQSGNCLITPHTHIHTLWSKIPCQKPVVHMVKKLTPFCGWGAQIWLCVDSVLYSSTSYFQHNDWIFCNTKLYISSLVHGRNGQKTDSVFASELWVFSIELASCYLEIGSGYQIFGKCLDPVLWNQVFIAIFTRACYWFLFDPDKLTLHHTVLF